MTYRYQERACLKCGCVLSAADSLTGGLADLRLIFERAGLVKIARQPEDEAQIVESWI